MSHDPDANEMIELLRDTREHAKFLGELGVETIHLPTAVEALTGMPAVTMSGSIESNAAATTLASSQRPSEFSTRRHLEPDAESSPAMKSRSEERRVGKECRL